jgi:hypothetical protein
VREEAAPQEDAERERERERERTNENENENENEREREGNERERERERERTTDGGSRCTRIALVKARWGEKKKWLMTTEPTTNDRHVFAKYLFIYLFIFKNEFPQFQI